MVSYKKINSFALVSVYEKKNINFLCNFLKKNSIGIISTGSTSKKIKSLGFDCFEISNLTKSSDIDQTVIKVTQLLKNQKNLEKQIAAFPKSFGMHSL